MQMVVDELVAVVGIDSMDTERQTLEHGLESL